jgi:glycosyltransferase involved in cell wall biosynthesis
MENHPELKPKNVFIIPSAIRIEDFAVVPPSERDPHKAVCMSAHERHLMAFIDVWPLIRREVPDATLDLFYGYDDWRRMPSNQFFAEHIKYFDRKRPYLEAAGVTFHARMPPKAIAQHMLGASVWLYPTSWQETWCAAAAQAQAAGLYSVTTDLAALPEIFENIRGSDDGSRSGRGFGFVDLLRGEGHPRGWNLEPHYQTLFVEKAVGALRYPLFDKARMNLRQRATERFGWRQCLDVWEALLLEESHLAKSYRNG